MAGEPSRTVDETKGKANEENDACFVVGGDGRGGGVRQCNLGAGTCKAHERRQGEYDHVVLHRLGKRMRLLLSRNDVLVCVAAVSVCQS